MNDRVEYLLVHLAILVPAFALLLLAQALTLRAKARSAGTQTAFPILLLISLVSLVTGFATGAAVAYVVAFGPGGYVYGEELLAWYTGLPGLLFGIWVVYQTTVSVGDMLHSRSTGKSQYKA